MWKDGIKEYTQEELDTLAELNIISHKIFNLGLPHATKKQKVIAEARRYAAVHLHELGYSHRQIAEALNLRSPQSVSVYLRRPEQQATDPASEH